MTPKKPASPPKNTSAPEPPRIASCNPSPRPPTGSPPTSEPGRPHGATSTASSASPATSSSPSTTPARAFPSASPRRYGARSPPSEHVPTQARRSGTAPAETASSPWSSSAKRVHAKAVTAGGESGNPSSPHFNDQAKRYSTGDLRDVYFYRSDLKDHIEREYHPGKLILLAHPHGQQQRHHNTIFQPSRSSRAEPGHRLHTSSHAAGLHRALASTRPQAAHQLGRRHLRRDIARDALARSARSPLELSTLVRKATVDALDHRRLLQAIRRYTSSGRAPVRPSPASRIVALLHGWLARRKDTLAAWLSTDHPPQHLRLSSRLPRRRDGRAALPRLLHRALRPHGDSRSPSSAGGISSGPASRSP